MKTSQSEPLLFPSCSSKSHIILPRIWGVWDGEVYDLTDYFNTINVRQGVTEFQFLDRDIATVFQERSGKDVTDALEKVFAKKDAATVQQNTYCIKNLFYAGMTDFRNTPRCQVQSYLMLVASGIIATTMLLKCMFPSLLRTQVPDLMPDSPCCIATYSQEEPRDVGQVCHLSGSLLYGR